MKNSIIPDVENDKIEFKTSFNDEVIETIVAFSNSKGGTIFLGVSDYGIVKGLSIGKEAIQKWSNEIKNKTNPQIIPDFEVFSVENKTILCIKVIEYPVKPVSIKGRYYKRVKNSNHLLSVSEVSNLHLQTINSSWDFFPRPGKTIEDIDFAKVQNVINTISKRNENFSLNNVGEFLEKNELVKNDSISNACFLLFSKSNNLFSTIELGFFSNETTIKDSFTSNSDILTQVEEVMSFIKKHINKETIITAELENIQQWQYPLEGIRELILNMIIHRDYTSSADSVVKVFPQHIELYNPGMLPDSITIDNLLSNNYVSYPRNRQIAKIVKELGWIEKYGTGIKRVRKLFAEYKLPEPEFKTIQNGFFVKLSGTHFDKLGGKLGDKLGDNKTKILQIINENPDISLSQLSKLLNISQTAVENHIARLKQTGVLIRTGSPKAGSWIINNTPH